MGIKARSRTPSSPSVIPNVLERELRTGAAWLFSSGLTSACRLFGMDKQTDRHSGRTSLKQRLQPPKASRRPITLQSMEHVFSPRNPLNKRLNYVCYWFLEGLRPVFVSGGTRGALPSRPAPRHVNAGLGVSKEHPQLFGLGESVRRISISSSSRVWWDSRGKPSPSLY